MCICIHEYKRLNFSGSRFSRLRHKSWYAGYFLKRMLGNNTCRTDRKEVVVSKRNQAVTYAQR